MTSLILKLVHLLDRIHPKAPMFVIRLLWLSTVMAAGCYVYGLIELCDKYPIIVFK